MKWLCAAYRFVPVIAPRLAKKAVDANAMPLAEGLAEEAYLFAILMREPSARRSITRALELGIQTREVELKVAELAERVAGEISMQVWRVRLSFCDLTA